MKLRMNNDELDGEVLVAICAIGNKVTLKAIQYNVSRFQIWPLTVGRLSAALARLEAKGCLVSGWIDGPYPRDRYYMLKPAGFK